MSAAPDPEYTARRVFIKPTPPTRAGLDPPSRKGLSPPSKQGLQPPRRLSSRSSREYSPSPSPTTTSRRRRRRKSSVSHRRDRSHDSGAREKADYEDDGVIVVVEEEESEHEDLVDERRISGGDGFERRELRRFPSGEMRASPVASKTNVVALSEGRGRFRSGAAPPAPFKRLIVCADGTWLNSDGGTHGTPSNPSNVTRFSRAVKKESEDGVQQVVYYHYGVGSQGGILDRVVMGTLGQGLSETVRESYSFLSNNYKSGDEIFLIGFSRGAFTVRTIAGLIGSIGILTKRGIPFLADIFKDVQHRRDVNYAPKHPDLPFRDKPSASSPRYREELRRRGMTDLDVGVKVIGVWDTVGSLGLPRIGLLTRVGLQSEESRESSFYDTKLSNCVENAFQALGLDERRTSFSPAVWEKPEGNRTKLRQVWFPGVHSNIGGGYPDQELSNITLAWMMSQCAPFLDLSHNDIIQQARENDEYYLSMSQKIRPWSFGKIINSMGGIYAIGGGTTRTPGAYFEINPDDNRITGRPLRDTQEYIHPSVRTRIRLHGAGTEDKGTYDPEAMREWKLVVKYPDGPERRPDIYWKARSKDRNVSTRILPESPLWGVERKLLGLDRATEEFVFWPPATKRERRPG